MKLFQTVAAMVLAGLVLSACTTVADTPPSQSPAASAVPLANLTSLQDPGAYVGPSTAQLADSSITAVTTKPEQTLPAQVVSHDLSGDIDVTVQDTSRVLALNVSGSIAMTVWGLGFGDTLVGRDISTTFEQASDLPVVTGGGHSINVEAVLALNPSVVITDGSIGPRDVVEQLRDASVAVIFVNNTASFEGAAQLAHDVAAIYGAPQAGSELADRITSEIEAVKADIERLAPAAEEDQLSIIFLYLRGNSGVYYLFGRESGATDLIEGLGGIDVAGQMGWTGMRPMTDEAILKANPDLILVMSEGLDSTGGIDKLLVDKPALALTKAGENKRFVDMADGEVLSFGPRSADVLEALARAVYAPEAQ